MTKHFIVYLFLINTLSLFSQTEDEKLLNKTEISNYYFYDDDMFIPTKSNDFSIENLNKINMYARGEWMNFSDKEYILNCSLDYSYHISPKYLKNIKNIKPLTDLFKRIYNYDNHIVYEDIAIITKGRGKNYKVYISNSSSCMASAIGLTYEEEKKHQIDSRFKIKYPFEKITNKKLPNCFILPIYKTKSTGRAPKHNIYYKDIDNKLNSYIGNYVYSDSINKIHIEITKQTLKEFLKWDNRKSYFIDKVKINIKHWRNNTLVFDTNKNQSIKIFNNQFNEYGLQCTALLSSKKSIDQQPLLLFNIRKENSNLKFYAEYSLRKRTYSSTDKNYSFPQYVVLKKTNNNYKTQKTKSKIKLDRTEVFKLLSQKWELLKGKGPQFLEFKNTYKKTLIVNKDTKMKYWLGTFNELSIRVFSENFSKNYKAKLNHKQLILEDIETGNVIIYKKL